MIADGTKLSQTVQEADKEKTTDYAGRFVYEDGALQFILHEEGRVTMTHPEPHYEYFLKDHLGNVRVAFTTAKEKETFVANLDDETEDRKFLRYDNVRMVRDKLFDHTKDATNGDGHAVRLSGGQFEQIGLAKSLQVLPGDKVHAEVYAKYVHPDDAQSWDNVVTTLMNVLLTNTVSPGVIDGASYGTNANNLPFETPDPDDGDGEIYSGPKAYLNYIFINKDWDLTNLTLRTVKLSDVPREKGDNVDHEKLELDFEATEAGYLYVYLSNDSEERNEEVFFDDFLIEHEKSSIIQVNDYYPFGLTFNSYSRENSVDQKFKFQGQEHVDELDLGWDSFKWRNHDPAIGRFFNIDPLAEKYVYNSPYAFSENHVISHRELEGLEKVLAIFYKGGPTGGGQTTTPEQAFETGEIFKSTQTFAQSEGREFTGTVIAPGWTSSSGVETGQEFVNANYSEGDQVVIYGYSYGVDNAMDLATDLGEQGITVNTLVTVDGSDGFLQNGTVNTTVPDNVMNNLNIYQTHDSGSSSSSAKACSNCSQSDSGTSNSPGSNGGPNSPTPGNQNKVIDNRNVTAPGVTHGNIQDKQRSMIQNHINDRIHNYYIPTKN